MMVVVVMIIMAAAITMMTIMTLRCPALRCVAVMVFDCGCMEEEGKRKEKLDVQGKNVYGKLEVDVLYVHAPHVLPQPVLGTFKKDENAPSIKICG